nr:hypothetical protein CFP56_44468 [Quercus suber]
MAKTIVTVDRQSRLEEAWEEPALVETPDFRSCANDCSAESSVHQLLHNHSADLAAMANSTNTNDSMISASIFEDLQIKIDEDSAVKDV